jgi:hypothetical protein
MDYIHPAAFFILEVQQLYFLYLDDSGSVHNKNETYLVLGGISVFERQVHFISQQLDAIASRWYPSDPSVVEFHASAIFAGTKPPWNGLDKKARRDVIKEVLGVLASAHESTRAFACAVHKASYPGDDPMEVAFEDLCSRFDLQLARIYHSGDPQRGIIILDESSYETSFQSLAHRFRSTGTRWRPLKNIPEVPLFVDSQASRLVQLSDHVAYAVFRRYESSDTSFLDIILSRFDFEEGKLHGLAHKQALIPNCMCPACMSRR